MWKGKLGVLIVLSYLVFAVASPFMVNHNAIENWDSEMYWSDYPHFAPPAWVNLLGKNLPPTENISARPLGENLYGLDYDFHYSSLPEDIKLKFDGKPGNIVVNLTTPSGETFTLYSGPGQDLDFGRNGYLAMGVIRALRLNISMEDAMMEIASGRAVEFLLARREGNSWHPVHGVYRFTVSSSTSPYLWITGKTYGVMGTDVEGRDLWQGFLAGAEETIGIVLATAFSTVLLGLVLGLFGSVSGPFGNLVEETAKISGMLPLIPTVVAFIPLLATVGYHGNLNVPLWSFVVLIAFLLFGKIAQNVKAMAEVELSKEYVESARALGAGDLWVIRKHVMRSVFPYILSQFVLVSAKAVALVSILGFFNVVPGFNWGTFMAMVVVQGAIYYNIWWMVIPVGLAIALLAVGFVLINMEIEERFTLPRVT